MRRRKFVQLASLLPTGVLLNNSNVDAKSVDADNEKNPVVISTWAPNVKANAAAWQVLVKGGTALDAVHQGVMVPEADPNDQSVGYGGLPDRDGRVTLDACIMDHQYNIGSVMYLEHIKHAITVARLVMEKTPHVQLVGEGALRLALENGMKKENLLTEASEKAWKEWLKTSQYSPMTTVENLLERIKNNHDTIGMLALDKLGNLSGACTTSGMAYKMQGRVGDSPIIGAGLFVDNEVGAATATGVGEEVVRICGSHTVVEYMRHGYSPADACKEAVKRLIKARGEATARKLQIGFIAMNKKGETGCYSLTGSFTMALRNVAGEKVIDAPSLL
ncbi:MAG: N(4)-(beta-N-acetylglucosaminyl)-L-asparaginase [Chitinophagaceae bacterium]|nr:N(4)-(beta-N-acetylglucosaminyl)-L-asparaginase [Chitinophagaceae bacterium]